MHTAITWLCSLVLTGHDWWPYCYYANVVLPLMGSITIYPTNLVCPDFCNGSPLPGVLF